LLNRIASATRIDAPATIGIIKVASDPMSLTVAEAMNAVAPAGGWVSRKTCIAAIDTATAAAIHTYDSDPKVLPLPPKCCV